MPRHFLDVRIQNRNDGVLNLLVEIGIKSAQREDNSRPEKLLPVLGKKAGGASRFVIDCNQVACRLDVLPEILESGQACLPATNPFGRAIILSAYASRVAA